MEQPRLPRNPVWPLLPFWREVVNDLEWLAYDLWRKWVVGQFQK